MFKGFPSFLCGADSHLKPFDQLGLTYKVSETFRAQGQADDTIFSATERENLHGHNFQVRCAATAGIGPMRRSRA